MSTPNVLWTGSVMDPSGYGEATRNYVVGLHKAGLAKIRLRSKSFFRGDLPDLGDMLPPILEMSKHDAVTGLPYLAVQHLTPEQYSIWAPPCRYHVGMTCFETDGVPNNWQVHMRAMDELWTFSEWGKKVFQNTGLIRPIYVIPHGVDSARFHPDAPMLPNLYKMRQDGMFLFGSNFDWTERKNPYTMIAAYLSEFKRTDNVALVLKAFHQHPIEQSIARIKTEISSIKTQLGQDYYPPIMLITDILPGAGLAGFYSGLNAYVLPSRGEGWSLTHSEAMSTGLPSIGVNWGGNTAYMNDENSVLIKDYKLVPVSQVHGMQFPHYKNQNWADVSIDSVRAAMRKVFDGGDAMVKLGKRARQDMVEKWSWENAVSGVSARINAIWQERCQ